MGGKLLNSKPCCHCVNEIKRTSNFLNIRSVVYSTDFGYLIEEPVNKLSSTHLTAFNKSILRRKQAKEKIENFYKK